jgi:hypothetical protein
MAERVPLAVGANPTPITQLAYAGTDVPQVLPAIEKSAAFAPAIDTLEIWSGTPPAFVSVVLSPFPLLPTGLEE